MKALVTGATGFIGSVLTRELLSRGWTVRALVLPGEDAAGLEQQGVEVRRGDLTDPPSLRGIGNGMDTVFHLAGRVTDWGPRRQFYSAIFTATENMLREAAAHPVRFIYLSSVAAMGLGRHLAGVKETDPPRKSGIFYNDAKADAEALVREYHQQGKVSATIIRPANVVGPGSVWVRDVVERMTGLFVPLFDGGRYSASLVYVDNLVDGILLAATKETAAGKAYHFRDDWEVTWKKYLTDLGAFVGKEPKVNLPYGPSRALGRVMDGLCNPLGLRPPLTRMVVTIMGRDNDIDTTLARTELGWKTRVSYSEAMEAIGAHVTERYIQGR